MRVRVEIGIDCENPERLAPFWAAALGYRLGDLDADEIFLDLVAPDPALPGVYLQRVPEPKLVKNRMHLDLYTEDTSELIGRLLGLGAMLVGEPQTGSEGGWWQVLADPEGNEFCVCRA